jgi:hypothetical protein
MSGMSRLHILVTFALLLAGCGSAATDGPSGPLAPLPAPGALAPRSTSAYTHQRSGDEHLSAPLSRVTAAESAATFAPQLETTGTVRDAAYAVYGFELPDYGAPEVLALEWATAPAPGSLYVAVADFTASRWDWHQPGSSASVAVDDPGLQRARQDGTDIVLVAVLLVGTQPAQLTGLQWGASVAPPDVAFTIDTTQDARPISPLIYGMNDPDWEAYAGVALTRLGGNRWTAYNWENNASNAGTDWFNQNDGYLSNSDVPGLAVSQGVDDAFAHDASMIVTVPVQGRVAQDKNGGGDVNQTPDYLNARFDPSYPRKGGPFLLSPDRNDETTYQDEFVNWLRSMYPRTADGPQLFYSLDNEPDLWEETHPRIQLIPLSYDALVLRSIDYANAIKDVDGQAVIFGPASYGWHGYETLQDAPDAGTYGNFLDYYLARMRDYEQDNGRRLLDVLDLHWYPEAQGGGVRITGDDVSPAVVAARLQAPRSLWDPTYTETSWITQWSTQGPIDLIHRMQDKILVHYPGTKLAFTEYNYGAGGHISGGIAQADVLGIFGREGVYAACEWHLTADNSYIHAAFNMFRNYDGAGARFLATSVRATTSDAEATSVYASTDGSGKVVLVALNKTDSPQEAAFTFASGETFSSGRVYMLTSATAAPQASAAPVLGGSTFRYVLPAMSVVTVELE